MGVVTALAAKFARAFSLKDAHPRSNMFKKRTKKNIRERQNLEEENQEEVLNDENEGNEQATQTEETNSVSRSDPVLATSSKVAAGRSLLSFEEELDGDVEEFQLKKSNESRRLARERQEEKERRQDRERRKRERDKVKYFYIKVIEMRVAVRVDVDASTLIHSLCRRSRILLLKRTMGTMKKRARRSQID